MKIKYAYTQVNRIYLHIGKYLAPRFINGLQIRYGNVLVDGFGKHKSIDSMDFKRYGDMKDELYLARHNCICRMHQSYLTRTDRGVKRLWIESQQSTSDQLQDRIARLAVLRELQVNKFVDIVSLQERIAFSPEMKSKLVGIIRSFSNNDGLTGETAGIDPENKYPYKRWTVNDVEQIKKIAKRNNLRLMYPEGKQYISANHAQTK